MKAKVDHITLGALAPPLSEQLAGRLEEKDLALLDAHSDAITRLLLHGYIPETVATRARQKLVKEIRAKLKQ